MSQRIAFNADWSFQQGEPAATGRELNYFENPAVREAVLASSLPSGLSAEHATLGAAAPYARSAFDDSAWRKLSIPHDWAIEGPFDLSLPGGTGKRPSSGVGWYRKRFRLLAPDAGQRIFLDVDGAMSYAMAWCNGRFVGGWPYGYSGFRLDLTPAIAAGAENVLAIRLDNPAQSSRWYPGAGLYRNAWMVKSAPVRVAQWGTYVTTPQVTRDRATVALRVEVANDSGRETVAAVETEIFLRDRRIGAIAPKSVTVAACAKAAMTGESFVEHPQLWDLDTPTLYTAVTTVTVNGRVTDRYETRFGIRAIRFTTGDGFHLNGRRVQIRGVCNHHDLGALGAAFNERAAERQLEILKEMGANALRTSHNQPAPELLDLCDRMGLLVMDESFDCWKEGKTPGDYHRLWDDWHEKDLRALCRRDRNHPSVILWSIGNEVLELANGETGKPIASALSRIVAEEDLTRPSVVCSNHRIASYNGIQEAVGVMGQNYERGGYAEFRERNPAIPLLGSETVGTFSSRGVYVFDTPEQHAARHAEALKTARQRNQPEPEPPPFRVLAEERGAGLADFQVSSYDLYSPGWGRTADEEFRALARNPHVAGEFVWTGFDYLGEPTPYSTDLTNLLNFQDPEMRAKLARQLVALGKVSVPSRSSYFGILDLAGFPKDRFYLYQAHWRTDLPMAHILPHWTWPDRLGLPTPVHVYTSGDEAELFLNGRSLGRKRKAPLAYRLRWDEAIYEPGELKVIACKGGRRWAEAAMRTAGPAAKLLLKADRVGIRADGLDLAFVTLRIVDSDLRVVPRAANRVRFDIEGPGEIVATDNGNPVDLEPFQQRERNAFSGLAMAIVRARPGQAGTITVNASSGGLDPAGVSIRVSG